MVTTSEASLRAGASVTVNRDGLAASLAAVLPSYIFWNPGTVKKVMKTRVLCAWPGSKPFWFDRDAVTVDASTAQGSELAIANARYAAIRARINSQPAGKPLTVDEQLEEQFALEDVLRATYPEVPR